MRLQLLFFHTLYSSVPSDPNKEQNKAPVKNGSATYLDKSIPLPLPRVPGSDRKPYVGLTRAPLAPSAEIRSLTALQKRMRWY